MIIIIFIFNLDCGDSQVNTPLPPIPKTVPAAPIKTVPSIEDPDCQGQAKLRALTKNKKNINKTINRHRYEVHGIPMPQQQQQQQQQQPGKKQKFSNASGGPPSSDDESNDGAIEGFIF